MKVYMHVNRMVMSKDIEKEHLIKKNKLNVRN